VSDCTGCWVERELMTSQPRHKHSCRFNQTGVPNHRGLPPAPMDPPPVQIPACIHGVPLAEASKCVLCQPAPEPEERCPRKK
jgi:hypothetical protein